MVAPLIADLHCDTALRLLRGQRLDSPQGHVSLDRLRAGQVGLQVFACWVSPDHRGQRAVDQAWRLIESLARQLEIFSDEISLVVEKNDWIRCRRQGKIGAILGLEGAHGLGQDLRFLEDFRRAGLRLLTITWNTANVFACSARHAQRSGRDTGLTGLGRELVAECNRLDVVLDLSHASAQTFWEVMELSKRPAVVSHSCVNFLQPHFRNLDDGQIRALAHAGWVLGINFYPGFLGGPEKNCGLERVADHFLYVKELAGADCLGMGSDFDGVERLPQGLEGPQHFPALLQALQGKGFLPEEIKKIASGNFLRLLGW